MEFDLERFLAAQRKSYANALREIKAGKKETHWMWYIFPQLKGLGFSSIAEYYGIESIEEARAYLCDEYLKKNLIEICEALLALDKEDISDVLGYPDNLKLKSSMTLFSEADSNIAVFKKVLDRYYNGEKDKLTLSLLKG